MGFSGTPKDMGPPKMVSGTHTIPIRIPKDMGIVWEAYHKGVPLLGVPENPIELIPVAKLFQIIVTYTGEFYEA